MNDAPNTLANLRPVTTVSSGYRYIRTRNMLISDSYIPCPKLEEPVQAFAVMHRLGPKRREQTPRSLLIQGPSGSGKTEIASHSLLALPDTVISFIPPSIFGSKFDGGAVEQVQEALAELSAYSHRQKLYGVALFDDVDHSTLALGDNVAHTTGPQEAIGYLQHLSTARNVHTSFDGGAIPFVATANAANRIAKSLFRHQRAKIITHVADDDTKQAAAYRLFDPLTSSERAGLDKVLAKYKAQDIAFWPALYAEYQNRRLIVAMRRHGADAAKVSADLDRREPLDIELLTSLAAEVKAARPLDFLSSVKRKLFNN